MKRTKKGPQKKLRRLPVAICLSKMFISNSAEGCWPFSRLLPQPVESRFTLYSDPSWPSWPRGEIRFSSPPAINNNNWKATASLLLIHWRFQRCLNKQLRWELVKGWTAKTMVECELQRCGLRFGSTMTAADCWSAKAKATALEASSSRRRQGRIFTILLDLFKIFI